MHVQIPTYIVRNDDISISNGDFMLYARLCLLHFKNYSNDEIKVDHKKLMDNLNISDTRTLKRRLESLFNLGLILNRPATMPRKGKTVILFNSNVKSKGNNFTMINAEIFNYIDVINEHAFRLLFYYKSHINKNDYKNSPDKKRIILLPCWIRNTKGKTKDGEYNYSRS